MPPSLVRARPKPPLKLRHLLLLMACGLAGAAQASLVVTQIDRQVFANDGTHTPVVETRSDALPVGPIVSLVESSFFRDGNDSDSAGAFVISDHSATRFTLDAFVDAGSLSQQVTRAGASMLTLFTLTSRFSYALTMLAGVDGPGGSARASFAGPGFFFEDPGGDGDQGSVSLSGILEPGDYSFAGLTETADSDPSPERSRAGFSFLLNLTPLDAEPPAAVPEPGALALVLAAGWAAVGRRRQVPQGLQQPG